MQSFGFSEHRIHERRWNNDGRMMVSRSLELFGPKGAGGRRDQAIFIFDSALDRHHTGQTVGFVNECRLQGISIVGWLPLAQFEQYRHWSRMVIRNCGWSMSFAPPMMAAI